MIELRPQVIEKGGKKEFAVLPYDEFKVAIDAVNVKGTTTEGMGFAGREEGIAAHAVALLDE